MIVKILLIVLFFLKNISVYSDDGISDRKLSDCEHYKIDNTEQIDILTWFFAVDSVDKCDEKAIDSLLSLGTISSINSNFSLLRLRYKFCNGVISLKNVYNEKYIQLKALKSSLNECSDTSEIKNNFTHKVLADSIDSFKELGGNHYKIMNKDQSLLLVSSAIKSKELWGKFIFYFNKEMHVGWMNMKSVKEL